MLGPLDMDRTELLLAHAEIQQLPYRYAYAQDFRDAEMLLSLWFDAEEPVAYPEINIHTVRAEHQRWFSKGPTVHFVSNHIIEIQSNDRAIGSVYCAAQLDLGEDFVDQSILYQDTYLLHEGAWLFERRRHLLWFGQARADNPIHQEPDSWPMTYTGRGVLPGALRASS